MATVTDEMVLCVPASALDALGGFQGFRESPESQWAELFGEASWESRGAVEDDPAWKQLIPYALLARSDDVLWYRRAKFGNEGRLHGKASLGFGGHVNPADARTPSLVEPVDASRPAVCLWALGNAIWRELGEECGLKHGDLESRAGGWRGVGLLNDDSNPVGRVHLGFCYRFQLDPAAWLTFAPEIEPLGFYPVDNPPVSPEGMESWSRLYWDALRQGR